ncbi:MAG TPA: NfeD family protein [Paenibacillus sp.]|uniref:NfeD family protein n=1 Tax=Paenibacillus sp. TaxID=58172 RepID=UPI0028D5A953|nr:NfeD family protein [Paenibacillus sp.]HUC93726.1 NfeD family protein [Paenibacillus sp.]
MEALFWASLAGGMLYAVVAIIFGDLISQALDGALDFLSMDGMPWLQPMTLVGGITVFGGAGLLLDAYTALGTAGVLLLSLLSGAVIGAGVYFIYVRPMQNTENSTGYSIRDMEGKPGEVIVPIPATGYGEVIVRVGPAGVTSQIAASFDGEPIAAGDRVVVVEAKGGTLYVAKLDL